MQSSIKIFIIFLISYAASLCTYRSQAQSLEAANAALGKKQLIFSSSVCEVGEAYSIPEEVFFERDPYRLSLEGKALTLNEVEIGLYEVEGGGILRTCKIGLQTYLEREIHLQSKTFYLLKPIDIGRTQILQKTTVFLVSSLLTYEPSSEIQNSHSTKQSADVSHYFIISPPEGEKTFDQSFIRDFADFFSKIDSKSKKNIITR